MATNTPPRRGPDYVDLQAQNTVFDEMTGYSPIFAPLAFGERSRLVMGQIVTGNHFSMLGVQPQLGRLLTPADDTPAAERVVVLSHRMWQSEFGGSPGALGQNLTLRGLPYTIIGVARPEFRGVIPLLTPELWVPMAQAEEVEPIGITSVMPRGRAGPSRAPRHALAVREGAAEAGCLRRQAAHANIALMGQQLASAIPSRRDAREDVGRAHSRGAHAGAAGRRSARLGATAVMSWWRWCC